jgi:hypothetical protein
MVPRGLRGRRQRLPHHGEVRVVPRCLLGMRQHLPRVGERARRCVALVARGSSLTRGGVALCGLCSQPEAASL